MNGLNDGALKVSSGHEISNGLGSELLIIKTCNLRKTSMTRAPSIVKPFRAKSEYQDFLGNNIVRINFKASLKTPMKPYNSCLKFMREKASSSSIVTFCERHKKTLHTNDVMT